MRLLIIGLGVVGLVLLGGCKEKQSGERADMGGEDLQSLAVELEMNRLEGMPGEVYQTQASSSINWQPWTEKSLKLARDSGRLIFAVIVVPQQPTFKETLGAFSANERIVEVLNQNYVPILIDGDAIRELGIVTANLCAEIKTPLQLPLLVWMTPDANPVAWIPLPNSDSAAMEALLMQSHSMVGRITKEDREYVDSNSTMDQDNRRQRMIDRRKDRKMSEQPEIDSIKALRQITSLYDPLSRTFDEVGGLFPTGSLDLLSMSTRMEALPDEVREKSKAVLDDLLSDLLHSAMFDPIDGGVFSSRRGFSWTLPGFYRDCTMQARVAASLLEAYEVTGNEKAIDRALGVLKFAEENFKTEEGLFSLGSEYRGPAEDWLWYMDQVSEILSKEELDVWVRVTAMEEIGNLPSEVDPLRKFFRANSLRNEKSAKQVAEEMGVDLQTVEERISSSRKKLLKVRNERMKIESRLTEANSAATFRMVSAYATAYRVTGDDKFLERAVETLTKAREHFSDGPRLKLYASDTAASLVSARAFVYGLAIIASLDVAAISLDGLWLGWADDLATTAAETFAAEDYLKECPPEADLINLPIADAAMLFDDSTAGLISMAEARMKSLGRPMLESFTSLAVRLPMSAISTPVVHTDLIQGSLMRHYGARMHYGSGASSEMKKAVSRVSQKVTVTRPVEGLSDEVLKIGPNGEEISISNPENIFDSSLPNSH